ncbi:WD40 repeat-like protein [Cystobasidium minutum MCA 4210]|uniref:WD40 repeat-like protein n=1 Tax=Cystobasidium minutum MCA 4210 TaxID=1397322 RepID=UPI0034CDEB22|eukprot:jgi/Rhomi1/42326/CE42325_418
MAHRLKTSFKLAKSYTPIYTGGAFAASVDGARLYTTLNEDVVLTEVESGERLHLFQGDTSSVTTLAVSPENASTAGTLLVAHRSLALRFHTVDDFTLIRSVARAHDAPITISASDPTGSLFATGSADGTVKVWDATQGHCTHVFKGHGGVMSALYFDINPARPPRLVTASDDCRVRVWDLTTRKALLNLDGHSSVVRGLAVTSYGKSIISGGRDKVYSVWNASTGKLKQTIPVYETLEGLGLCEVPVPPQPATSKEVNGKGKKKQVEGQTKQVIWTAGDSGKIKFWDLETGQSISATGSTALSTSKTHEIVGICQLSNMLITAHVDQNIVFHALPSLEPVKHIVGFNDEVIDTLYLSSSDPSSSSSSTETHLAVATNSDLIRIYDLSTFDTALLAGHADVVLCLARNSSGTMLFSGSKDKTARLWRPITAPGSSKPRWVCVAIFEGHLESIGAVAIARKNGLIAATASQDKTVKLWDLTPFMGEIDGSTIDTIVPQKAHALTTVKVHDKDINSVDFAPNDKILATGSQDRTAKVFGIDYTPSTKAQPTPSAKLTPLGLLKGHKRGVWSVKFSPTEQCVATASGDQTIKLWNINDFSCLKTLEGHTNTILRLDFLPSGQQLVSSGSDGLVKVWNLKDEECVATLDNHEDKIWALAINRDASMMVSGGADSVISFWEDVTEQEEDEKAMAEEEEILKSQDLANYMEIKDYRNAILLALSMDQPRRLLGLMRDILSDDPENVSMLKQIFKSLESGDIFRLLEYIRDWNAKSRDSDVAQAVLNILLKTHSLADIMKAAPSSTSLEDSNTARKSSSTTVSELIQAILPYTERHYARADRREQESAFLDFILAHMDDYAMPIDISSNKLTNGHGEVSPV